METVLNLLLVRFVVIAAVAVAVALILFAIAVGLRRRGRWEHTRDKVVSSALPIIKDLARSQRAGAIRYAADKVAGQRHDQQQSVDGPRSWQR